MQGTSNKEKALQRIALEIARCPLCRKGATGTAVPGEGNADARVLFVGEAPGTEEARTGRPFVGRSGAFLRRAIQGIGLDTKEVFITSPVHYLPLGGTPTRTMVLHGREHLFKQLEVIEPHIVVLLGSIACLAVLGRKPELTREHGSVVRCSGRKCFITFHPAYAMRFPGGKTRFLRDLRNLKKLIASLPSPKRKTSRS